MNNKEICLKMINTKKVNLQKKNKKNSKKYLTDKDNSFKSETFYNEDDGNFSLSNITDINNDENKITLKNNIKSKTIRSKIKNIIKKTKNSKKVVLKTDSVKSNMKKGYETLIENFLENDFNEYKSSETYNQKQYTFDFQNQKEELKSFLKENGFVVVTNIIDKNKIEEYQNRFFDLIAKLSGDQVTGSDIRNYTPFKRNFFVMKGGMIQYIAHTQLQWDLRLEYSNVFKNIWGCENLKTSMDGMYLSCYHSNSKQQRLNIAKIEKNSRLHTDQHPTKDFVWSYQGFANLWDADDESGGLVVIPKSNLYHKQYFIGKKAHKGDWYMFSDEEKQYDPRLFNINCLKVNAKAGDFVLWDSRTFHSFLEPRKQTFRLVCYICQIPSSKVSSSNQLRRKKAFEERRTTSHHPNEFRIFPKFPRFIDKEHDLENKVTNLHKGLILSDLHRELI